MIPSLSTLFIKIFKLESTADGGPAMMGQIKQTIVNEYSRLKEEEFLEMVRGVDREMKRKRFF